MPSKVDREIKKLKKWLLECELVMAFFGAITTVWVFFSRLLKGQAPMMKSSRMVAGAGEETGDIVVEAMGSAPGTDWIMIISIPLFMVFIGLAIYLLVKVMKKHMNH